MAFDENRKCDNCFYQLVVDTDPVKRCRFNAPVPRPEMAQVDNSLLNTTRYIRCPEWACGQWQPEFEEPVVIPEQELPDRINK
jgi:hypothetical protein